MQTCGPGTHRPPIPDAERVVVCYVSGLDHRRLSPELTPTISATLAEYPTAPMVGFPDTDLASTIMTGVFPHAHGLWQVALDPDPPSTRLARLADRLPDLVTTTAQCAIHAVRPSFDLPAVPYHRREGCDKLASSTPRGQPVRWRPNRASPGESVSRPASSAASRWVGPVTG